jgi:hypothetical protein
MSKWHRQYLILVVQSYEGDKPDGWDDMDDSDRDQYVCDNWTLTEDRNELLDYDELKYKEGDSE